MNYYLKPDYIIIRRHWILTLFRYLKLVFYSLLSLFFYFLAVKFGAVIWEEITWYILFPASFLIINYAFFKLILWYIEYYNNLLIIHKTQFIVIKASLVLKDDLEIIDLYKVTKMDTYCRWIISNLLWFWTLVIEQQWDTVKNFGYIPNSHRALRYLKRAQKKTNKI